MTIFSAVRIQGADAGVRRLLARCTVLLMVGTARAADLNLEAHIDQVTVYRQSAIVTRVGQVTIPAGAQRLIISGLPAAVSPKSLQVTAGDAALRLGAIEVVSINEANFVSEPERELRRRIEEAGDQQQVLQDEVATAQDQLKLLDSLAANPAGSPTRASVDAANLAGVLATMANGEASARKRVRDANLQLRTLSRQIEQLRADLAKVATARKRSTQVRVSVMSEAAVTTGLSVSYSVADAGWEWIYQARLDTAGKHLVIERQGSVSQGTGEDWNNVELTLTTAMPAGDIATPVVGSLFVDLQPPVRPSGGLRTVDSENLASVLNEVTVTGRRRSDASVTATEYVADYHVPARVSVPADRQDRVFPIGASAFDVSLVARVLPEFGPRAHLEATFKYTGTLPLEAGQLQLYRDGAFIGEAATRAFLPGADVRMPFGVDERVRVAVREEPTQSGQRGLIGRQMVNETRRRIDITNYHPNSIPVEVIDRVPVSQNEDVHVEILKGATDPTVKDVDGKAGVWMWKIEPQPQQTVSIHQAFAVQYPAGRELAEHTDSADP